MDPGEFLARKPELRRIVAVARRTRHADFFGVAPHLADTAWADV